jgi:acetate kinase
MMAVLMSTGLLAFMGGIGENDAQMRAEVCDGLSWLGIDVDKSCNSANGPLISSLT